jgi:hypothetical protein
MGYQLLMLLNDARVQEELGLTFDQRKAHVKLVHEYLATGPLDEPERLSAFGATALERLTPSQRERLNQVMFQLRSVDIFRMQEFLTVLAISDDQTKQIDAVRNRTEAAMRKLQIDFVERKMGRPAYETKVFQGLVEAEKHVDEILDPKQRAMVAQWRGKRIFFGRMHLRLVLSGRPDVSQD